MYHAFYGVRESPFSLTPDPRYLFATDGHKEALASVIYGLRERKGFVLILGEVGTGKTTLVRHILGRLGDSVRSVYVLNAALSFEELLQTVLRDLELPCPTRALTDMTNTLNEYLLAETLAGRQVVVIIDEAQHLSSSTLEALRLLSNLETNSAKLLQVVLVGQPELGPKLGRPQLRQFRQRIGLVAELKPLTRKETGQYIAHRLRVAGAEAETIFTPRAIKTIHAASRGIPRLINVICDKALVLGYAAETRTVGRKIVRTVVRDWSVFGRRSWLPRGNAPMSLADGHAAVGDAPARRGEPRRGRRALGTATRARRPASSPHARRRTRLRSAVITAVLLVVTAAPVIVLVHGWFGRWLGGGGIETPAPVEERTVPPISRGGDDDAERVRTRGTASRDHRQRVSRDATHERWTSASGADPEAVRAGTDADMPDESKTVETS